MIKYENERKPCNLLFIKEAEVENSLPFEAWNYRKTFYDRDDTSNSLKSMYVCMYTEASELIPIIHIPHVVIAFPMRKLITLVENKILYHLI